MSTANLTAKYRPQRFADVAGQDAVKAILSRAAAEDKVAPAYLFSGTRGVGKTTIARIFAKALNCEHAPTAEPCNECVRCRQATAGVAVDVVEIDAASHGGVDDARALKEDVGYAPLEGRYKVFIIDEAHMLSLAAFNALLKTLEEPPPRVTFILATTEAHKFPATIISRCQHYTFKMLPQRELEAHLSRIMDREGLAYEPGALSIIAKRGAGSVRDSMSLLGQALALGEGTLREADVRAFLGLAGQEVFFQLMAAIHGRDLLAVSQLLRRLLDQGVDIGFFLRELASAWRTMFLLRQAGPGALSVLSLSAEEGEQWGAWAARFEPAFIHAAWQLTLEGQRRVMSSLEPALALELLLLNLASLPDLLGLEHLGEAGIAPAGGTSSGTMPSGLAGSGAAPAGPTSSGPASSGPMNFRSAPAPRGAAPRSAAPTAPRPAAVSHPAPAHSVTPQASAPRPAEFAAPEPAPVSDSVPAEGGDAEPCECRFDPEPEEGVAPDPGFDAAPAPQSRGGSGRPTEAAPAFASDAPGVSEAGEPTAPPPGPRTWEGFQDWVVATAGTNGNGQSLFRGVEAEIGEGRVRLSCPSHYLMTRLSGGEGRQRASRLLSEYFGPGTEMELELDAVPVPKTRDELLALAAADPVLNRVCSAMDGRVVDAAAVRPPRTPR